MSCAVVLSDCKTPFHLTDAFYTLPMVKDFIIDVLLGSPHIEVSTTHYHHIIISITVQVRSAAADQFNRLCKDVSVLGGMQLYYCCVLNISSLCYFTGQSQNADPSQVKRS